MTANQLKELTINMGLDVLEKISNQISVCSGSVFKWNLGSFLDMASV